MPSNLPTDFAARLNLCARIIDRLDVLEPENVVQVQAGPAGAENEISVHHCQPEQLAAIHEAHPSALPNVDADGIVRWLGLEYDGAVITFFRR